MNVLCCFKNCKNGPFNNSSVPLRQYDNAIQLDTSHMGHEVVIIKNGTRICGSGGALANAPLVQSKSYFEVKLQQGGHWSVGLASRQTDLNKNVGGMDKHSWCLCSDNIVRNDDTVIHKLTDKDTISLGSNTDLRAPLIDGSGKQNGFPEEGDTIGISYDHIELNFYLNGKNLEVPVLNIKGTVYPSLYVDDGAILDINLEDFTHTPPSGFERIMIEQSIL